MSQPFESELSGIYMWTNEMRLAKNKCDEFDQDLERQRRRKEAAGLLDYPWDEIAQPERESVFAALRRLFAQRRLSTNPSTRRKVVPKVT